MKPLILASKSPRRKELLTRAGIDFTVETAEVEEHFDPAASPGEIVMHLSEIKADAVFQKHPETIVLGSDTIVVLDGRILGKPKDVPDAVRMLTLLSGRTHEVYTGVTILSGEKKEQFFECTRVTFFPLTEEEAGKIGPGPLRSFSEFGLNSGFSEQSLRNAARRVFLLAADVTPGTEKAESQKA